MDFQITRQGVKNLNSMGTKKPRSPCPPHIASKWKEELAFPNSAFDDWDFSVPVERRRCVSCDMIMDEKNYRLTLPIFLASCF